MKIYSAEKHLETEIKASLSFDLFTDNVSTIEKPIASLKDSVNRIQSSIHQEIIAEKFITTVDNPHLYFGRAILCSTSINRNDDVFLPEDVWEYKATAVDTPYNRLHKKKEIVGHIIGIRALDESGTQIESNESNGFFELEAEFVVYSHIFPDFVEHLSKNAEDGESMVSLECLARDFDYALFDEGDLVNPIKVIARNEETAFLTENLRCYNGSGVYEGQRIGRVPRQFAFSGMADVVTGANPRSYYTALGDVKFEVLNNVIKRTCINNIEGQLKKPLGKNIMTPEQKLEEALAKITELESQLSTQKNQEAEDIKANLDLEKEKVSAADEKIKALKASLEEKSSELSEASEKVEKLEAEAEAAKLSKVGNDRISELESLGREFKADEREDKIKMFASMSDETFDMFKDYATTSVESKDKDKEKMTDKDVEASTETDEVEKTEQDELEASLKDDLELTASQILTEAFQATKSDKETK